MLLNFILGGLIVALLGWVLWDVYQQTFSGWRDYVPPASDANQDRLSAIASAEEFRRYARQGGYKEAYNLTGEAIASLYKPEEPSNGEG
jgi:hypothetical protein